MTKHHKNKRTSLLLGWVEKPYYLNNGLSFKLFVVTGMGILTTAFLLGYKPKALIENTENYIVYSVSCGFVVSLVLGIYYFIIRKSFPTFFDKNKWNIGKHILSITILILTLGGILWIFNQYILFDKIAKTLTYSYIIKLIFEVGFFPLIIYLMFDERYGNYSKKLNKDNLKKVDITVDKTGENSKIKNQEITVYSYNKKDAITFNVNDLVYITSEANYGSFFILNKGKLNENILRKSLSKIEEDLKEYSCMIRLHKSYIVNTKHINSFRGNAHGYFLQIKNLEKEIPVSRKFSREEISKLVS